MARVPTPEQDAELSALAARCALILDAFERAEPNAASLPHLRETVDQVAAGRSLPRMRMMLRELLGMQAALPLGAQRELSWELAATFGPDPVAARDAAVVARVRARGRIQSEREYRVVCAYANAIAGDPAAQEEFLALGGLLDRFSAAP